MTLVSQGVLRTFPTGIFARIINTLIVTVLSDAEADIGMTVDLRKRKFQHPPVLDAVRHAVM
jgi:hypothetical protein